MEACINYLKQFPGYTRNSFELVEPHLSKLPIKAGDYFLRAGKTCKQIAYVESGLLRLYYLSDGKEVTNCFCKENTLSTSYSSFITQTESEISIQAVEDTSLIVFPHSILQKMYEQDPFWQQMGRIASENEYLITEAHNRFIRDLTATERYQHVLDNENELLQRVPLNHLATYLQIAPETLSRIRNKVRRT